MPNRKITLSDSNNYLFTDADDKYFVENLIQYLLFGDRPMTSPALWQDVEIFVRFKNRDVWELDDDNCSNARQSIWAYRLKYLIEHLKKSEILALLETFFAQSRDDTDRKTFFELLCDKLHAPLDSLILTQEKLIIRKDDLNRFDEFFSYPRWIEFDASANAEIREKILRDELTDEQIDYFLGASDTLEDYDRWFTVAKHILSTTKNAHTFWTAGDVLSIIWKAIPDDEKSQKWFRDEIFEIFWPHVGSVWPLKNQSAIDFDQSEETKIMKDSIGWLEVLVDLKERLPELGDDYELDHFPTDSEEFSAGVDSLLEFLGSGEVSADELLKHFFSLPEVTSTESDLAELKRLAEKTIRPALKRASAASYDEKSVLVNRAIKHAEDYVAKLQQEKQNLAKIIK